jgi:hypothetical protein
MTVSDNLRVDIRVLAMTILAASETGVRPAAVGGAP